MNNETPSSKTVSEFEDKLLENSINDIEKVYQQYSKEIPDIGIDRQILAAAHREILKPNKKQEFKSSFWRKLSLPLYATATFAFTAVAVHILMPEPVRVPPGTSSGSVEVDIIIEEVNPQTLIKNQVKSRSALLIKEEINLNPLPEYQKTQTVNQRQASEINNLQNMLKNDIDIQSENSLRILDSDVARNNSIGQVKQNTPPNKDQWSRNIINLYKKGDYQAAQTQLQLFKKTYPDYPIDEQIESFK